jgi:hypothetical protein
MVSSSLPSSFFVSTNSYSHEWVDGMGKRWRMTDLGIHEVPSIPIPYPPPQPYVPSRTVPADTTITLPPFKLAITLPWHMRGLSKPYAKKKHHAAI